MSGRYLARCARAQDNKKVPRPKVVVLFIVTSKHCRCRLLAAAPGSAPLCGAEPNEKTTTNVVVFSLKVKTNFDTKRTPFQPFVTKFRGIVKRRTFLNLNKLRLEQKQDDIMQNIFCFCGSGETLKIQLVSFHDCFVEPRNSARYSITSFMVKFADSYTLSKIHLLNHLLTKITAIKEITYMAAFSFKTYHSLYSSKYPISIIMAFNLLAFSSLQ